MSKFWSRVLWALVALVCIGMIVVWLIPTPQRPGDASEEEKQAVIARINEAQEALPHVKLDKIKAHGNRVVELNVTWTGENPPPRNDRRAWGIEADRIAVVIASDYLPEGWQVNVALWYRRLPRGVAGRIAGDDPEGGPAWLFHGREGRELLEQGME
ncbi:MAG: hypothetical protein GX162_05625 [Firmicutes bacterium]|nr:hypothetical protein [Bacillota bacterium]